MSLTEHELWLLSYYRVSEISGSLFFGRLARVLRPSAIQHDLSKHYADEAQHAWYWTECIDRLGAKPLKLSSAYQDQYLEAAGLPANLMEILAITQVFERRVINQYTKHRARPNLAPQVTETLDRILRDEHWHVTWVRDALAGMETRYGREEIRATLRHYREADRAVYANTIAEHDACAAALFRHPTEQEKR
jgi:bacterioferritin (cytochrome b1)